jgi:DNA-binding NarL/FixJ family response regulator
LTRIVAFVPDLLDRSRVSGAMGDVRFLGQVAALESAADDADVLLVDLARAGVIDAVRALPEARRARVVGFARHDDTDTLDAARAAGCDAVFTRNAFFADPARRLGLDDAS